MRTVAAVRSRWVQAALMGAMDGPSTADRFTSPRLFAQPGRLASTTSSTSRAQKPPAAVTAAPAPVTKIPFSQRRETSMTSVDAAFNVAEETLRKEFHRVVAGLAAAGLGQQLQRLAAAVAADAAALRTARELHMGKARRGVPFDGSTVLELSCPTATPELKQGDIECRRRHVADVTQLKVWLRAVGNLGAHVERGGVTSPFAVSGALAQLWMTKVIIPSSNQMMGLRVARDILTVWDELGRPPAVHPDVAMTVAKNVFTVASSSGRFSADVPLWTLQECAAMCDAVAVAAPDSPHAAALRVVAEALTEAIITRFAALAAAPLDQAKGVSASAVLTDALHATATITQHRTLHGVSSHTFSEGALRILTEFIHRDPECAMFLTPSGLTSLRRALSVIAGADSAFGSRAATLIAQWAAAAAARYTGAAALQLRLRLCKLMVVGGDAGASVALRATREAKLGTTISTADWVRVAFAHLALAVGWDAKLLAASVSPLQQMSANAMWLTQLLPGARALLPALPREAFAAKQQGPESAAPTTRPDWPAPAIAAVVLAMWYTPQSVASATAALVARDLPTAVRRVAELSDTLRARLACEEQETPHWCNRHISAREEIADALLADFLDANASQAATAALQPTLYDFVAAAYNWGLSRDAATRVAAIVAASLPSQDTSIGGVLNGLEALVAKCLPMPQSNAQQGAAALRCIHTLRVVVDDLSDRAMNQLSADTPVGDILRLWRSLLALRRCNAVSPSNLTMVARNVCAFFFREGADAVALLTEGGCDPSNCADASSCIASLAESCAVARAGEGAMMDVETAERLCRLVSCVVTRLQAARKKHTAAQLQQIRMVVHQAVTALWHHNVLDALPESNAGLRELVDHLPHSTDSDPTDLALLAAVASRGEAASPALAALIEPIAQRALAAMRRGQPTITAATIATFGTNLSVLGWASPGVMQELFDVLVARSSELIAAPPSAALDIGDFLVRNHGAALVDGSGALLMALLERFRAGVATATAPQLAAIAAICAKLHAAAPLHAVVSKAVIRAVAVRALAVREELSASHAIAILQSLIASNTTQSTVCSTMLARISEERVAAPLLEEDVLALCDAMRRCEATVEFPPAELDAVRNAARAALEQWVAHLARNGAFETVRRFGALLVAVDAVLGAQGFGDPTLTEAVAVACLHRARHAQLDVEDLQTILRVVGRQQAMRDRMASLQAGIDDTNTAAITSTLLADLRSHAARVGIPSADAQNVGTLLWELHRCSPLQFAQASETVQLLSAFESRLAVVGKNLTAENIARICVVYRDVRRSSATTDGLFAQFLATDPATWSASVVRDVSTAASALRPGDRRLVAALEARAAAVLTEMNAATLAQTLQVFARNKSAVLGDAAVAALQQHSDAYDAGDSQDIVFQRLDGGNASTLLWSLVMLRVDKAHPLFPRLLRVVFEHRRTALLTRPTVLQQLHVAFETLGRDLHPDLYDIVASRRSIAAQLGA